MDFELRQFRSGGRLSYLLFERVSSSTVLIDGDERLGDDYRTALGQRGLKLSISLDTTPGLNPGTRVPASGMTTSAGPLVLRAFSIAGSGRPGSVGLVLEAGRPAGPIVFAGHAWEVGRSADPDASPAPEQALRQALRDSPGLLDLPDATPVFPAGCTPGREGEEVLFSTLGVERRDGPSENLRQGTKLTAEKYRAKLASAKAGEAFVDVREVSEFAEEHIPGTSNLPLSELGLRLSELARHERIYLSCLSGRRSGAAASSLERLGISSVVTIIGGIQAWKNAGLPTEKG